MRTKLTALIVASACLAGAASALAGPVPVAFYAFSEQSDVDAFVRGAGSKCKKKLTPQSTMSLRVGPNTNSCAFYTGVVADSSDTAPDQEVLANVALGPTPKALGKKAYIAVKVRASDSAGYELRVRPVARNWQLFRDPKGAVGPSLFRSGKGKFIRKGQKPNVLVLRAFDYGSADTRLVARINKKTVASLTDSGADQPDGKRNGIASGVKGAGAGTGVTGIFDNVTVKIPNPF